MKYSIALLLLLLSGPALSSGGSILPWKKVAFTTEDNITVEAAVDEERRLVSLRVFDDQGAYELPAFIPCGNVRLSLDSLVVYRTYLTSDPTASNINLSIKAWSRPDVGQDWYYEFNAVGRKFETYKIKLVRDDATIRPVTATLPLEGNCQKHEIG